MAGLHDALFKVVFERPEHATALLLPHVSTTLRAQIDWSTMTLLPGSFVDEQLKRRHCDLLFRVASFAGPIYVHVLLEHQSSDDPDMTLRILVYLGRIWSSWRREHPREPLPLVIPLVISNVPEGWVAPTRFSELFLLTQLGPGEMRHVPDFEILVEDLCRTSEDALFDRLMARTAKLALWLLRNGRNEQLLRATLHRWAPLFAGLPFADFALLVRYLASMANDRVIWDEFHANLHAAAPEAAGVAMSLYDQWIAEGEARGVAVGEARGEARGVVVGEATLLTKLLIKKFGPLPEETRSRLATASIPDLETWAERVLFASSLEQVFSP